MDGLSGSNGRGSAGVDVGQSLPPGGLSKSVPFAQHSVRRMDVTRSLMLGSLRKRTSPARSLDEFRRIHQIDPKRSISEQLETYDSEEPSLDDEGLFMSIQNEQFDEFGQRVEVRSDQQLDPELDEGIGADFLEADLLESLTPASISRLRLAGPVDVEGSLNFSVPSAFSLETAEVDEEDTTPTQSLVDRQTTSPDDEDDEMFYSVQEYLSPQVVQQALEQSVAASLMPSSQAHLPPGAPLAQVWSSFNATVVEHLRTQDGDISTALHKVLDHYPAVTNREKAISMLMREVEALEDAEDITATCQQLLQHFKTAGEVSLDHPEAVFEKGLSDVEALQTLMIVRQKALDDKVATVEHLAKIEELMARELTKRLATPVAESAGLGIDPDNPDYPQYTRLQAAAGLFSVPEKEVGPGIRNEKILAGKKILIKPGFNLGKVPEMVFGAEMRKYGADVMSVMTVKYAAEHHDGDIARLMKMDDWLSDDEDEGNQIPYLMGVGLEKAFLEKAGNLGFVGDLPEPSPAAKSKRPKRVMFSDQEGVIPRDEVKLKEAGGKYAHVDDVVEPSRDMMSHMSVRYVDRLVRVIDELKKSGEQKNHQIVHDLRTLAEESLRAGAARKQTIRQELMGRLDKMYDGIDERPVGSWAREREEMVRSLPYVKADLLDADATVRMYQTHLENAVVSCLTPLIGRAQGRPVYKYTEVGAMAREDAKAVQQKTKSPVRIRDTDKDASVKPFLVPNTVRRGAPPTQDMLKELSFVTKPYHQAMEADLSSQAAFCHSLSLINDPRTMLALRARMGKEGKAVGLYVDNWSARMKEVMCCYQATQILQSIDSHVQEEADARYERDERRISTAPAEFMENMTAVCVEDAVRDIQAGRFKKPGVSDSANVGLKRVWHQLKFKGKVDETLASYMPTPDQLLRELEGYGVISKAEPGPTEPVTQQGASEGISWIVNAVSGWLSSWTTSS